MAFANDAIGGTTLVRKAIKSPNFVHNVSGWSVNKDGSAEFDNLTLRGTFLGLDYIINSAGIFLYSGTPGAGNLIASLSTSGTPTTDSFGNTVFGFISTYDNSNKLAFVLSGDGFEATSFASGSVIPAGMPMQITIGDSTNVSVPPSIFIHTPSGNPNFPHTGEISIFGESSDGTTKPQMTCNVPIFGPVPQVTGGFTGGDDWHSFGALQNTWARVVGEADPSYRMLSSPAQTMEIAGTATVTVGANTAFGTVVAGPVPAGYRPANRQPVFFTARGMTGAAIANAQGFAVTPAGNLVVETVGGTAGDVITVRFHGFVGIGLPTH